MAAFDLRNRSPESNFWVKLAIGRPTSFSIRSKSVWIAGLNHLIRSSVSRKIVATSLPVSRLRRSSLASANSTTLRSSWALIVLSSSLSDCNSSFEDSSSSLVACSSSLTLVTSSLAAVSSSLVVSYCSTVPRISSRAALNSSSSSRSEVRVSVAFRDGARVSAP